MELIIRTDANHPEFIKLVSQLDAILRELDGVEHVFYAQFNKIDTLEHVVLLYIDQLAVGCGALKKYSIDTMEIKRMYVLPEYRSLGIATKILSELESWMLSLGNTTSILETGIRQKDAIALYQKNHYIRIPSYGQYKNVENSVCFSKILTQN
ncbi:MAG: GNAT family N-acetyltransferase [Saprospiraceae bacterium]|nr:GNAT family N-acetyltransferase [Saprospiraceae bacterium]